MNRANSNVNALTLVLLVNVLVSAGLYFYYGYSLGRLRDLQVEGQRLQVEVAAANRDRALTQALAAEALDFARRNPAMDVAIRPYGALFQQLGLTNRPAGQTPNSR